MLGPPGPRIAARVANRSSPRPPTRYSPPKWNSKRGVYSATASY